MATESDLIISVDVETSGPIPGEYSMLSLGAWILGSNHEFYIEKPIAIIVSGSYHGLGAFVSDVADLSRIVTLHDFTIRPIGRAAGSDTPGSILTMSILARTYRYNDERG